MVFSSMVFLCVFLPAAFCLHLLLPGMRAKNFLLVVASLVFYAYGEPIYVILLVASSAGNYILARLTGECPKIRKLTMTLAVVINLGLLVIFKYSGFLVETFNSVTGAGIPVPHVRMPIGISFFTFQALSYVIDVYRGDASVQKNFGKVLLYISFFPQLIAGPIVKYHDVEAEINNRKQTPEEIGKGIRRFIAGLSKKILIANTMGLVADNLFGAAATGITGPGAWLGAVSYMLQIYFDFSGYSDMAIGLGHIFGFDFPENFNYPLISGTVTEFWRRWHMTLSSWFKDYVYIPLGGSRCGKLCQFRNILIVWMLTGLWHGAGWQFILWGLIFALCLMAEKAGLYGWLVHHKFTGHLYVALVLMVSFVIFQSPALDDAIVTLQAMAGFFGTGFSGTAVFYILRSYAVILAVSIIGAMPLFSKLKERYGRCGWLWYFRVAACMMILILCTAYLTDATYNPFLYFRF